MYFRQASLTIFVSLQGDSLRLYCIGEPVYNVLIIRTIVKPSRFILSITQKPKMKETQASKLGDIGSHVKIL